MLNFNPQSDESLRSLSPLFSSKSDSAGDDNQVAADKLALSRKDYADYEFIVREIERLLALGGIEERMKYYSEHKEDALATLWGMEGRSIECTRRGAERFAQIIARGLEAMGPPGRKHSVLSLTSALKRRFVDKALEISANTTDENAHEIFDSLVSEVEKEHKGLTHHIPCSLAAHHEPSRFVIGPVRFVLRDIFMKENEAALRQRWKSEHTTDLHYDELQRFFSKYDWVASVQVPACDSSVSKGRAQEVVKRVLDFFKLVVGGDRAARVRQAYDLATPNMTVTLASTDMGEFSISWSRRVAGAIVPDDWYRQISEFKPWQIGESIISDHWKNWEVVPEPLQRFLDGLSWHGDALSDTDSQAAILKFWTAIERVVSLKENDHEVIRRASVFSVANLSQFPKRFRECQRLYAYRSKIIHGAVGYKTPKSSAVAAEMEDLSKRVVLFYLFVAEGLKSRGTLTRDALREVFDNYDKLSRQAQGESVRRRDR